MRRSPGVITAPRESGVGLLETGVGRSKRSPATGLLGWAPQPVPAKYSGTTPSDFIIQVAPLQARRKRPATDRM
jgi:hypothetical protein